MHVLLQKWFKDTIAFQTIIMIGLLFQFIFRKRDLNSLLTVYERILSRQRISLHKSLYINFRSLPYKIALKMPIVAYTNVEIQSLEGKIKISNCEIRPLMIQLGVYQRYRSKGQTRINNHGIIVFQGEGKILRGSEITVFKEATLSIGNSFFIGENALIFAAESVVIGKNSRIAFNSIVCDSDFHYMINVKERTIRRRTKSIEIGDYNWIANNVVIKKGVKTPNYITVAGSYSVLSKDYSKDVEPFSILAGNPAKIIATGYSRVWKDEKEKIRFLNHYFSTHPDDISYELLENEQIEDYTF